MCCAAGIAAAVVVSAVVSDAGCGGQVLLDSVTFSIVKDRLEELGQVRELLHVLIFGMYLFMGAPLTPFLYAFLYGAYVRYTYVKYDFSCLVAALC
jgi:hypothetical protein